MNSMSTLLAYNNVWIDLYNISPQYESFYDYRDDEVPVYSNHNLGEIKEGVSYEIFGYMPLHGERFAVHLVVDNPTRDIALRINPRLPQNYIVRNSRINRVWGVDDDASAFPFNLHRGQHFAIQILVTDTRYMISINGSHFAKYIHRLPYSLVTSLEVNGDVSGIHANRKEVKIYPDRFNITRPSKVRLKSKSLQPISLLPSVSAIGIGKNIKEGLPLPFCGLIEPNHFGYGKHLRIEGRSKLLPYYFYLNLQSGQHIWPHPIVPLHIRCGFGKHRDLVGTNIVTRTAWFNGKWGKQETSELITDFRPGKGFSLVIARATESFEIYCNEKFLLEFHFRIDPEIVDTVFILGDIRLWDVVLEDHDETIYFNPKKGPVFHSFLQNLF